MEFKVGDKVVIKSLSGKFNTLSYQDCLGKEGIITEINRNLYIIDNNKYFVNFLSENLELVINIDEIYQNIDKYVDKISKRN